jgi:type IV pilus assembly protein PilN
VIKVNLLKSAGATVGISAGPGESPSSEIQKQAGMRLGVILGAIAVLYVYNMFVVSAQQDRLKAISQDIAQIEQKKASLGPTTPLVEKYNAEKKTIEGQLDVLRVLARNRLREVKALDAIQSLMSDKTWLKELKTEGGSLSMSGYSLTDDGITDLIRALDSSVFFSDLVVKSTSEDKVDNAIVKKFDVEFKIGARNE